MNLFDRLLKKKNPSVKPARKTTPKKANTKKTVTSTAKQRSTAKAAGTPRKNQVARIPGSKTQAKTSGKSSTRVTKKANQLPKKNVPTAKATPQQNARATPKPARGLMGFFKRELGALRKEASSGLTTIRNKATNIVNQARAFTKNPVQAIKTGASRAVTEGWNKVKGAKKFVTGKVNQFKKWYATPEGKAKFWKGVALAGVAVATVATGGALTAPALALAAGVSAGGGIAAKVVENKVYNAAAKAKAKKDKNYKYTVRKTFQGVTAKSVAVDALVGSVGGPVFKFAGKALVGSAAALGKGALPALKGAGQLGAGATRSALRRILPGPVKTALKSAGNLIKKNGQHAFDKGKTLYSGAKDKVMKVSTKARDKAAALYQKTAGIRTKLADKTKTIRDFAKDAPGKVKNYLNKKIKAFRKTDRKLLRQVRNQVGQNPAYRAAKGIRDKVDTLGNKASKKLVQGKVKVADGMDNLKARAGEKLSQTTLAKHVRNAKDETVKRLDNIVRQNPDSHYSKAIVEFRASGTAIRTHLNKVWSEASQDLNKDMSRLLGRHGSVQADFKALAEKSSQKAFYAEEVQRAKDVAAERIRKKVAQDAENAYILQQQGRGLAITDDVRRDATLRGQQAATAAVNQASDRLTRQAETFVARHPTTVLEEAALKTQALEASKKAAEHYFGQQAGKKGLFERTGMMLTTPFRVPVNERLEKYDKVIKAVRSNTPLSSMVLLGTETTLEQTEKAVSKGLEVPFKDWADRFKGNAKPKEAKAEDASVVLDVMQKTLDELMPNFRYEELETDVLKQLNMKDDD